MIKLALYLWPCIALMIAARVPRPAALVWMVVLPYLFLPENIPEYLAIDLPGLPPLEKATVIAGSLILAFALIPPPGPGPRSTPVQTLAVPEDRRWLRWLIRLCIVAMIGGSFITIWQNGAPLRFLDRTIPGAQTRDLLPTLLNIVVTLTPFFLARRYLVTPEDYQTLLRACVVSGLIYTLFMLVELRLSPQLHNWVYGYHQHSFGQHIRGGYRPKVFLPHGLEVGFFMLITLISALALWKQTQQPRWAVAAGWLAIMLVLSRNLGALLITLVLATVLITNLPRWIRGVVFGVCLLLLAYPAIRTSPLSPVEPVLNLAEMISEERAQTFGFRLHHEDALLEKAMEKPLFGWGGWGRNRIFDEYGRDRSVTDGLWIIHIGSWGWVGYISLFTIICAPLVVVARHSRRIPLSPLVTGMLLITVGNLIYIIPNSKISPIVWLMVGALFGYALRRGAGMKNTEQISNAVASHRPRATFTRFPGKVRQEGQGRMVSQTPTD